MNIVFLDAFTLNPFGDFDISELHTLGNVTIYDRTPVDLILERTKDADVVLTNKCPLNRQTINALPNLKYIGVVATGYNIVDVETAKERGIVVANARGYSSASVAQLVFSLILTFTNRTAEHSVNIAERWSSSPDWCFYHNNFVDLEGKTLGIIGLGDIGKKVVQIGLGFGMKVLGNRKNLTAETNTNVEMVSQGRIFAESDFISLHCPLTTENQGFINKQTLGQMKPSAYLINTSRGGLINELDLADALNTGQIAGAGLDVLSTEPPSIQNPLLTAKNCVITPHIAWSSIEARTKLLKIVIENIRAFQNGKPQNVV